MQLKEELVNLKRRDYAVSEDYDYMRTAVKMLENIGTVDDELRDELIYFTFSHWILQDCFSGSELRQLLNWVCDDRHMFYKIGESHTDSVFTRSFSVLLIPLLLLADEARPYLTPVEVNGIKDSLIRFLRFERDYRGYMEGKGWAHSIAHAADAVGEISKRNLAQDDLIALLEAIRGAVCIKDRVYTNMEDDRLTTAVIMILEHEELDPVLISNWLNSFTLWEKSEQSYKKHKIISNVKNFLAALYFRLSTKGSLPELAQAVKQVRQEIMKPYT
ncbi:DUF2785 domain-containing protein [Paenibacillus sp. BR2-3]|uniref:DUF2785 domain-containing protein n=1 Tax=Paenibacillus sp. BR2-3 TaxID=3048494 RepID=UPI00397740F3